MTEAISTQQKCPYSTLDLKAGTHYWCSCGHSTNQPFCDGSHKGTTFTPVKIELEQDQQMILCGCKRTKNVPHCDGRSHNEP